VYIGLGLVWFFLVVPKLLRGTHILQKS
jgi:hypothetical protein